ncbi:hypothetical protein AX15_002136 [Amanita polypyramis BW_CC]|nr:hypothetical protein AX15_002136 [Amanita polypyramis BW_CC]
MEAMWTRFQPLSLEVKRIIDEGSLGAPVTIHADISIKFDIHNTPKTHRILNPQLGGGALLDIGPYPLVWAIIALHDHSDNCGRKPSNISGAILKTPLTDVDSNTSFTLTWSSPNFSAQAILSCSINAYPHRTGAIINLERGTIKIPSPLYCPKEFTVEYYGSNGKPVKEERKFYEYAGGGWHFQADEVARCLRDGGKESSLWGHEKSLLQMEIFDQVYLYVWSYSRSCYSSSSRFAAKEVIPYLQVSRSSYKQLAAFHLSFPCTFEICWPTLRFYVIEEHAREDKHWFFLIRPVKV